MASISAVLPAYNEESNVSRAVYSVMEAVASHTPDFEIIVVDDGSHDRTSEIVQAIMAEHPQVRLVRHETNRGYGGALRSGFEAATKELVFLVASDNQYDPAELSSLLPLIHDADIVTGYRAGRRDPFLRRVYAWSWNLLVNLLFGYLARDVDCAFKLFRREVLDGLALTSSGALIDTQFLAGARHNGCRIREVAVTHFARETGQQTGANVRVVLRAFRDLMGYWWELRRM